MAQAVWRGVGRLLFLMVFTAAGLVACTTVTEEDRAEIISTGEPLYIVNCARCHQLNGEGAEGLFPPLAGNPVITLHDPAPIIDVIVNGRGSMPAFRGTLDSEAAAAVISYIRNTWGNEASIVQPKQVPSN